MNYSRFIKSAKKNQQILLASIGLLGSSALAFIFIFGREGIILLLDKIDILPIVSAILSSIMAGFASYYIISVFTKRMNVKVYLSYANDDSSLARKLIGDLRSSGFNVLYDRGFLLVGDNIKDKIRQNLDEADFIIIILPKELSISGGVKEELDYATKSGKKIFPILKEETEIPEQIRGLMYADFFRENYDEAIKSLIRSLKANASILHK